VTAPATIDNRRPVSESAERFLRAVLHEVPLEHVVELHRFASLRQGPYETGIAVIAAWAEASPGGASPAEAAPVEASPAEALPVEASPAEASPGGASPAEASSGAREGARHTVYTARYRLVVKGPDRGRWEFECTPEAEAPLVTVETVVRGVQRRSGDLEDPVRYDADALAHVLRLEPAGRAGAVPAA
jgi:hypothetical protein